MEVFSRERERGKLLDVDDVGRRFEAATEELQVADEEVRAQQELIDSLLRGRTAERMAAVRLAAALPVPLLGTDGEGVIREANPAAAALLHLDPDRLQGKPLAVMVRPSDRRALRSAVTRAAGGGAPEHLTLTLTPRRDRPVDADVVVIGEQDRGANRQQHRTADEQPVLRWVIAPRAEGAGSSDAALLTALGAAARLSTVDTDLRTALGELAALATLGIAPALWASIAVGPPWEPAILVSTDEVAQAADGEQHRAGSGPSWEAYADRKPVHTASLHSDARWPALRLAAPAPHDAALAVPLVRAGKPTGVLTVYGTAGLTDDAQVTRTMLFADAAAALLREHGALAELRRQEEQLREALTSRAVIDQAKGILMGRHGIDADAAFAELVRRSQHANVKLREVARQLVAEVSSTRSSGDRGSRPVRAVRSTDS